MNDRTQKHICPICKKETTWEGNLFRPFCSERCRLIDLGKWASGDYRIAGKSQDMQDKNDEGGREKNKIEE
jgi:endogenous inhibitor of DNA gyrase (YacG/DUF329 family)